MTRLVVTTKADADVTDILEYILNGRSVRALPTTTNTGSEKRPSA